MATSPSQEPTSVQIYVANASPADVQFLRNVVALLTDPAFERHADKLKTGNSSIHYETGGALAVLPLRK